MDATDPLGEVDAVNAIAGMLDGPEDSEPVEQEALAEEPTQDAESEEAPQEAEPEEEAAPVEEPEFEIKHEGKELKLTKSQIKDLAEKGYDYTQKTQTLAEQRRQFEAQAKVMQESIAIQNQQIEVVAEIKSLDAQLAQFKDVNWHQLAESDPVQYLKLNQTFRDMKEARDGKVQAFQQAALGLQQRTHQLQTQHLEREAKALADAVPEFRGPKAAEVRSQVKDYLKQIGFSDSDIGNAADHRVIRMAFEAAQWRSLQASKPQLNKRAAEIPKVVKPGTPKAQVPQVQKDTYAQLRKTGRGEYAAKLIEQML